MRQLTTLLLLLSLGFGSSAGAYAPDLAGLDTVPLQLAPTPIVAKAISTAVEPRKEDGPFTFATGIALKVSLDQGRWEDAGSGVSRWRTRLLSPGARALSMEFADFHIPEGGELWVYSQDGKAVQGPYTAQNHTPEGMLWTALVGGDSVVIEARIPTALREQLHLELGRVFHSEIDPSKDSLINPTGHAGACNINVACSEGNDWTDEARSTVVLVFPVNSTQLGACTGVLVNSVRQDNTPYVLTANHCRIRSTGTSRASSVVVHWLYQGSACDDTSAPDNITQSGTTFIARDDATDFTLLKLNAAPPAGANAYFAGWDVTNTPATAGAGLHHPVADIKKISRFNTPLVRDQIALGGSVVNAWRVTRWADGVTEGGSSGSGLWNEEHHVVGLLSGGRSQCKSETKTTDGVTTQYGPDQPDFYARLDKSWNAGTPKRLGEFLDPDGTGATVLCGRNPAAAPCAAEVRTVIIDPAPPAAVGGGNGGGSMPAGPLLFLMLAVILRFTSRHPSRA